MSWWGPPPPTSCEFGELQEVCTPGTCSWDGTPCRASVQAKRDCPVQHGLTLAGSNLAPLLQSNSDGLAVALGFACLFLSPLIVAAWVRACRHWPFGDTPLPVPPGFYPLLLVLTALLVAFGVFAPADVWGGCEQQVCVYHSMFCEHTRHEAAFRHPANTWSNLVYLANGCFLCAQALTDLRQRSTRAYAALDASFGVVSLLHAFASVAWHGSNCPEVHFVDIGLMNCIICFFPLRFSAMAVATLLRKRDGSVSAAAAAAYPVVCALLLSDALRMTPLFMEAFPTGPRPARPPARPQPRSLHPHHAARTTHSPSAPADRRHRRPHHLEQPSARSTPLHTTTPRQHATAPT